MIKLCTECGTKNLENADYCSECGSKLNKINIASSSAGMIAEIQNWWKKRTGNEKALTAIGACCLGIIIIIMAVALTAPETTNLSILPTNAQIDDKTTEYIINGTSEPNATINIAASSLNLNNNITTDANGSFAYKVEIPIEVTGLDVSVKASKPNKLDKSITIKIQRPETPLELEQPANITENDKSITIKGKTDPQAEVLVSSTELNLRDVKVSVNSDGTFQYDVQVPDNITFATVTATSKSAGKKTTTKTTTITRTITTTTSNSESSSDTSTSDTSSSTGVSGTFVGSINSDVYHYPSCASAKRIKSYNLITFSSTTEAKADGYRPCKKCNPPG